MGNSNVNSNIKNSDTYKKSIKVNESFKKSYNTEKTNSYLNEENILSFLGSINITEKKKKDFKTIATRINNIKKIAKKENNEDNNILNIFTYKNNSNIKGNNNLYSSIEKDTLSSERTIYLTNSEGEFFFDNDNNENNNTSNNNNQQNKFCFKNIKKYENNTKNNDINNMNLNFSFKNCNNTIDSKEFLQTKNDLNNNKRKYNNKKINFKKANHNLLLVSINRAYSKKKIIKNHSTSKYNKITNERTQTTPNYTFNNKNNFDDINRSRCYECNYYNTNESKKMEELIKKISNQQLKNEIMTLFHKIINYKNEVINRNNNNNNFYNNDNNNFDYIITFSNNFIQINENDFIGNNFNQNDFYEQSVIQISLISKKSNKYNYNKKYKFNDIKISHNNNYGRYRNGNLEEVSKCNDNLRNKISKSVNKIKIGGNKI